MLVRVIIKNLLSFKEETEFNLLTSSKITELKHHKVKKNNLNLLTFSAIYGANASGKSNLIKIFSLIKEVVINGKIPKFYYDQHFRYNESLESESSEVAIEFIYKRNIYFYTFSFLREIFTNESLYVKKKDSYINIFSRDKSGVRILNYNDDVVDFINDMVSDDENFVYYIGNYYKGKNKDFNIILNIQNWFKENLVILFPNSFPEDKVNMFYKFIFGKNTYVHLIQSTIKLLNLDIENLNLKKTEIDPAFLEQVLTKYQYKSFVIDKNGPFKTIFNSSNLNVFYYKDIQNSKFYKYEISAIQKNGQGVKKIFKLDELSDGTNRLIDMLPIFLTKINTDSIIIIDEIERSLHPLMIKKILNLFTEEKKIKGQLIFTTHESNLLDLSLFRKDEIWFAEKNYGGATEFYPLSYFSKHQTKDIQSGYLQGRYGAIPFLGDLKQLLNKPAYVEPPKNRLQVKRS